MKKMIHASGLTGLVFRAFMFLAAAGLYSNAAAPADANAASGEPEEVVRGLRLASDEAAPGYVLYNSRERMNVLLDRAGKVVHSWPVGGTSTSVYLLGNGNLLRCARETNSVLRRGGLGGGSRNYPGTVTSCGIGCLPASAICSTTTFNPCRTETFWPSRGRARAPGNADKPGGVRS